MYNEKVNDDIFCKIIRGELAAEFEYRDEEVVAFRDVNPAAPVHLLIVPTKHLLSLSEITENDQNLLAKILLTIKNLAEKKNIANGFKVIVNNGENAGQIVPHLHFHLMGGWKNQKGVQSA